MRGMLVACFCVSSSKTRAFSARRASNRENLQHTPKALCEMRRSPVIGYIWAASFILGPPIGRQVPSGVRIRTCCMSRCIVFYYGPVAEIMYSGQRAGVSRCSHEEASWPSLRPLLAIPSITPSGPLASEEARRLGLQPQRLGRLGISRRSAAASHHVDFIYCRQLPLPRMAAAIWKRPFFARSLTRRGGAVCMMWR